MILDPKTNRISGFWLTSLVWVLFSECFITCDLPSIKTIVSTTAFFAAVKTDNISVWLFKAVTIV